MNQLGKHCGWRFSPFSRCDALCRYVSDSRPGIYEMASRDNGKDLMSYLGDTPKTNFKQAQLIHWLALPEEYRDPSTESALAQKLGVNRSRARPRSSTVLGLRGEAGTLRLGEHRRGRQIMKPELHPMAS